jgi:hypothetical protein
MNLKKYTQKDKHGNMMAFEFEMPQTNIPPMQGIPDHPGGPRGSDTVPAWLTPGEFVVNKEATDMYGPMIKEINNKGRAVQAMQGKEIPQYAQAGKEIDSEVSYNPLAWITPEVLNNLRQTESGGKHLDDAGNLIKSPRGAIGAYQWLPKSAANAGYGVQPFDITSEEEQRKATQDYLVGIQQANPNFTPEQVLQSYNAGPTRMREFVAGKGKPLTNETIQYPGKVLADVDRSQWGARAIPVSYNDNTSNQIDQLTYDVPELDGTTPPPPDVQELDGVVPIPPSGSNVSNTWPYNLKQISNNTAIKNKSISSYPYNLDQISKDTEFRNIDIPELDGVEPPPVEEEIKKAEDIDTETKAIIGNVNSADRGLLKDGITTTGLTSKIRTRKESLLNEQALQRAEDILNQTDITDPAWDNRLKIVEKLGGNIDKYNKVKDQDDKNVLLHKDRLKWKAEKKAEDRTMILEAMRVQALSAGDVKKLDFINKEIGKIRENSDSLVEGAISENTELDEVLLNKEEFPNQNQITNTQKKDIVKDEKANTLLKEITARTNAYNVSKTTTEESAEKALKLKNEKDKGKSLNQSKGFFAELFGDLIDTKELARMAVMYAGSRALGNSHEGSLGFAAVNYIKRIDTKAANREKTALTLIAKGKHTTASIAAYKKSGDENDLILVGAPINSTGKDKYLFHPILKKKILVREFKQNDNVYWSADGGKSPVSGKWTSDGTSVRGSEDFRAYTAKAIPLLRDVLKDDKKQYDKDKTTTQDGQVVKTTYKTDINITEAAGDSARWAAENGLAVDEMGTIVSAAYRMAIEQSGGEDKRRPKSLIPYLNFMKIRQDTQVPDLFARKDSTAAKPVPMEVSQVNTLSTLYLAKMNRPNQTPSEGNNRDILNIFWQGAAKIWAQKLDTNPELLQQYKDKALKDQSPFYVFAKEELDKLN